MILGLRTVSLPQAHLDAELIAAPFASHQAFTDSLITLSPQFTGHTGALWRAVERQLVTQNPGLSLDELQLRRDRIWFPQGPESITLLAYLRSAAKDLDAQQTPPSLDTAQARTHWRWLTFALPPDLLLAAVGAHHERPQLVGPTWATRFVDGGLAETHLHLKAAIEFPALWNSLLWTLGDPQIQADHLAGPGVDFAEGRMFTTWLLRSGLTRLLLAGFLYRGHPDFSTYLTQHAAPELDRLLGVLHGHLPLLALRDLLQATNTSSFSALHHVYGRLITYHPRTAATPDEARALDPLSIWFPGTSAQHPNFAFTRAAFTYLNSHPNDQLFSRTLWQVIRLRVRFYRHIVQRPMTPGLLWFTRTYARLKPARRALGTGYFMATAAKMGGPGLRSLEVRVAPEDTVSELLDVVEAVAEAARVSSTPEVGIIVHFSRQRGQDTLDGKPEAYGINGPGDPAARQLNFGGYRYAGYFTQERNKAGAFARVLTTFPLTLSVIRGVDICTDELGIPLWVLKPLVEHVKAAAAVARRALSPDQLAKLPRFRTLAHAGEDFVHLLGGIRRVDEAVERLGMGDGDRIGHAVALGVDPLAWARSTRCLIQAQGERLLDLVWASRVARVDLTLGGHISSLRPELERCAFNIFKISCTPSVLEAFVDLLYSTRGLRSAGFPTGQPLFSQPGSPEQLVYMWLTSRAVFRRANKPVKVEVDREATLLASLQRSTRRRLTAKGIIVEINPSSNLLVGHLGTLKEHPLWRLCSPFEPNEDAVSVCIGSDDPITFATRLPEEYQQVHDALVDVGLSSQAAVAWLERARVAGMTSRSTITWRPKVTGFRSGIPPIPLPLA